jgi:hypothetical protein
MQQRNGYVSENRSWSGGIVSDRRGSSCYFTLGQIGRWGSLNTLGVSDTKPFAANTISPKIRRCRTRLHNSDNCAGPRPSAQERIRANLCSGATPVKHGRETFANGRGSTSDQTALCGNARRLRLAGGLVLPPNAAGSPARYGYLAETKRPAECMGQPAWSSERKLGTGNDWRAILARVVRGARLKPNRCSTE